MGNRRRAREYALQVLFQMDLSGGDPERVLPSFWATVEVAAETRDFAESLVHEVCRRRTEIDRLIAEASEHWRLERMAVVDRNVLRIAVAEMLADVSTPPAIAIDEAIEIARKYGSGESARFINGILDAIGRRLLCDAGLVRGPNALGP